MQEIKICGITQERELDKLYELNVDYAGFVVFFPKSRRNNHIEAAERLVRYVKKLCENDLKKIKTVAVTVSPDLEQLNVIENAGFDILQVHGELDNEVKNQSNLPIWRAFNMSTYENEDELNSNLKKLVSDERISGILFDGASYGSGESFKWDSLNNTDVSDKLFIMAGGLTPQNVKTAIETLNPDVADVSSGVEYDDKNLRGKDLKKIESFVQAVREI